MKNTDNRIIAGLPQTANAVKVQQSKPFPVFTHRRRLFLCIKHSVLIDPAVGTATFLNEVVKNIFFENNFKGQEGRWTKYVDDDLIVFMVLN